MVNRKERIILQKMIVYANEAILYAKPMKYKEFIADNKTAVYSVFHLLQIGELISKLDDSFKLKYPEIAWGAIKGLRNKIVHQYEGISYPLVWDILKNDVPELIKNLSAILEKLDESEEKPNGTKN